jgi:peroxiredoxin
MTAASPAEPRTESGRNGVLRSALVTVTIFAVIAALAWFMGQAGAGTGAQGVTLSARAAGPAPKMGEPAPGFQLLDLEGEPVTLADFRGRPVWITFWASWCPPCRAEAPDIEATYERHSDAGLVVLALDLGEDAETARGYTERTGLSFVVLLDQYTEVAAAYRITGIPTHYFVDAGGILRDQRIGPMGGDEMERRILDLLAVE